MSLNWIGQDDFSVGWLDGVGQDQLAGVGLYIAQNGLFDDDGDVYRRGPVQNQMHGFAPTPGTFMWTGWLGNVYSMLLATAAKMYAGDGAAGNPDWTTFADLGAPGLVRPVRPAVVADLIFLPSGFAWGGSVKAAYSTGTISITAGSASVVGVGTAWATLEPGMFFQRTGGTVHRIKSIEDATHLTLDTPAVTTVGGAGYAITNAITGALKPTVALPGTDRHVGAIFNRLVIAGGNIVTFSKAGDPFTFDPTDYHRLPDGVVINGLATIRDTLLVFTDSGLWSITGMAFDLTDDVGNPQQALSRLTPEISLAHESGIADWAGSLVVPCTDRVFLVDGLAPPVPISDSVQPAYANLMNRPFRPGGAEVFRNHYFLPWGSNTGPGGAFAPNAVWVCRLSRPVRSRQTYYAWSYWTRAGGTLAAAAADQRSVPILRGLAGSGDVLYLTSCFPPFPTTANPVTDWDGTTIEFDVATRDVPTGNGQPNHVRRMRIGYEALGAGNVKAAYAYGTEPITYQAILDLALTYAQVKTNYATYDVLLHGYTQTGSEWLSGDNRNWHVLDPQNALAGVEPLEWDFPNAERVRYIAGRIRVTDPLTTFKLRRLQFACRPATHQR